MSMFEIKKGTINKALRVCVYGIEGIGKSTFASQFPGAVFIDTEGSTNQMDVARYPSPSTWEMLLSEVEQTINNPSGIGTLVIDTADWAQQLCVQSVCAKYNMSGIEDFGFGKGYSYVTEEFGKLLNLLNDLVDKGVNAVLIAHSAIRTFTKPDEMGQYDRYELKLIDTQKCSISGMVKEWADLLLFANYETFITEDKKTKKKYASGNQRVMYTTHTAAWDAKNRFGMPDKLPFDYKEIAMLFENRSEEAPAPVTATTMTETESTAKSAEEAQAPAKNLDLNGMWKPTDYTPEEEETLSHLPKQLTDLMRADNVHPSELSEVVADQGHFPVNMPIDKYDPDYYLGFLVPNWKDVMESINERRELPF